MNVWILYFNQARPISEPSKRSEWGLPESLARICWCFLAENSLRDGSEPPGPCMTTSSQTGRAARTQLHAKSWQDTLPPLWWQQLTWLSSVTSQESICACPLWCPGVMTKWSLFLATRMRIPCSCRVYWTLRSKMPHVRSDDTSCWAIAVSGGSKRWMKMKIWKLWQYQQTLLSVPSL